MDTMDDVLADCDSPRQSYGPRAMGREHVSEAEVRRHLVGRAIALTRRPHGGREALAVAELREVAERMYEDLADAWDLLDFEHGHGDWDDGVETARRGSLRVLRWRLDRAFDRLRREVG